jgi:hypothetical protein
LVDTASAFTVVLDELAWKRIGAGSQAVPGTRGLQQTSLSRVRLGAYDIPNVPAYTGVPKADLEQRLDTDVDGLVGSGLLGAFRITWADGGKALWLEDAAVFVDGEPDASGLAPAPDASGAPPGTEGAPGAKAP